MAASSSWRIPSSLWGKKTGKRSLDRPGYSRATVDWLDTVEEIEGVRFIALDAATAVESTRLPGGFHKDPADRMIVALARRFNAELITADEKITAYRHVKTIW